MGKIRLDALLADAGAGTRREVKLRIRKGQVTVNGLLCLEAERKVDPDADAVCLEGRRICAAALEYYMLYKKAGSVSATRDGRYPTVLDPISSPHKDELFPVGRLDRDTEGLLLITNDGELAHRLLSPRRHVEKTYFARVRGCVTEEDVRRFAAGLEIGEKRPTLPAELTILSAGEESQTEVTICEGKYHQIKRMFQAVGKEVLYLKRLRMGALVLDEALPKGAYRPLTPEEIRGLKEGALHE